MHRYYDLSVAALGDIIGILEISALHNCWGTTSGETVRGSQCSALGFLDRMNPP